ncbi:MAG: hypothetical protein C0459_01755 [Chitinophaga sp.]|jgi:uncharacterized damage-inducible protein DinB|nr:hypothetical protein [Chitinophaga sp.]
MKELLCLYATYNHWANKTLLNTVLALKEDEQHKPITSSFAGLYETWLHVLKAETIWWQRLNNLEKNELTSGTYKPTMHELADLLNKQDVLWSEYLIEMDEADFKKLFAYKNLKGEPFEQPLFEVLHHLFNHATYHRGQVVTMLRQSNVEKIPATDFVHWVRTK